MRSSSWVFNTVKNTIILLVIFVACCVDVTAVELEFVDEKGNALEYVVVSSADSDSLEKINEPLVMNQVKKQFSPRVLPVRTGQSVSFPNSDNIRHHIYSFSEAKSFEVNLYSNDESPVIVFEQPGVVVLGCNIHDLMLGYIYVSDTAQFWVSDANGRVQIPEGVTKATYWHPDLSVDHSAKGELRLENKKLVYPKQFSAEDGVTKVELKIIGNSLTPNSKQRVFGSNKLLRGQ